MRKIMQNKYSRMFDHNAALKKDRASSRNVGGWLLSHIRSYRLSRMCRVLGHNVSIGKDVDIRVTDGGVLKIGKNVTIAEYTQILLTKPNPHLYIGDEVTIGRNCIISAKEHISVGDYTLIGPYVQITDTNHGIKRSNLIKYQLAETKPVKIGYDCWIGSGAKILAGVTIGNGCVIGANAVVTKDIPDFAIAVGCPAKVVKYRQG